MKLGDLFHRAFNVFKPKRKAAVAADQKVVLALQPYQIATLIGVQILIIILYAQFLVHEKYPKDPDIYPYPAAGEEGGPEFQQPEPVIPFKRYPPGYDINGKRPDGSPSQYGTERILQRQFKYQLEIVTYVYLGFGMQYSFLRKFGYSTLAFGLLAASIASQCGFLTMQVIDCLHCNYLISVTCEKPSCNDVIVCADKLQAADITGTWDQIIKRHACTCWTYFEFSGNNSAITERPHHAKHALRVTGRMDFTDKFVITSPAIMEGLYATVPVQITMGMLLGKVSLSQLSTVSFICVLAYGVNFWICTYILGAYDNVGGSCIIHLFGACFGIGCTLKASLKGSAENPDNAARYNADVMAIIGTILNWMTFPTFNAYYAPAAVQQAVVINTYLSLFSSCVASMIFSSLYSGQFKLDPADIQRSSLAGGVAISSVASLFARPPTAMIIGLLGGFVCSTAHHFLRRLLEKKLAVTDTVGAISLHALPGLLAWVCGIIAVWPLNEEYNGRWSSVSAGSVQTRTLPFGAEMDLIFLHSQGNGDTALYQVYLAPVTMVIGLVAGFIAGLVANFIKGPSVARTFSDSMYWIVPEDFQMTEDMTMSTAAK